MCLTQQTLKPLTGLPTGNLCSRIVSAGKRFSDLDTTKGEWFPPLCHFALPVPGLQWYRGDRTGLQGKGLRAGKRKTVFGLHAFLMGYCTRDLRPL
jgi:hypothetical protein